MNDALLTSVRWLIGAIARGIDARRPEGWQDVLGRLSEQDIDPSRFAEPQPRRLPVLRHLPQCLAETMLVDSDLCAALAAVEDHLEWRQSEAYSDTVMGEGFMSGYGWSQIVGPHGFFPGDDFLLGLLLLGPRQHYRDHYHPAPELYWVLTGPTDWKHGAGGYQTKPADTMIWHRNFTVHATKTDAAPMLAVWCWTRDVATPAKLIGT